MEAGRRTYRGRSQADRRADRRTRLLAAALDLWGEHGCAAVTVRGVCGRAGLTDRYFYESFADRETLVVSVYEQVEQELLATLLEAMSPAADGSSGSGRTMVSAGRAGAGAGDGAAMAVLRAVFAAFISRLVADPRMARVAAEEVHTIPALQRRRRETPATVARLVAERVPALKDGRPDAPGALLTAAYFSAGGVSQLVLSWLDGAVESSSEEIAEQCARLCGRVFGFKD